MESDLADLDRTKKDPEGKLRRFNFCRPLLLPGARKLDTEDL